MTLLYCSIGFIIIFLYYLSTYVMITLNHWKLHHSIVWQKWSVWSLSHSLVPHALGLDLHIYCRQGCNFHCLGADSKNGRGYLRHICVILASSSPGYPYVYEKDDKSCHIQWVHCHMVLYQMMLVILYCAKRTLQAPTHNESVITWSNIELNWLYFSLSILVYTQI